jgi:ParB/RepB/Spo0J family partition protein
VIRQIETKIIPLDSIEIGDRYQQPSEAEIKQISESIKQDGLLTPIGVYASNGKFRLLYGATRLLACKALRWTVIRAVLIEGSPEELASAELIENLKRRHLDKDQRDDLTKELVRLRTRDNQKERQKELNDGPSPNSSLGRKTHPKRKVGGSRGRPATAEGKAKKDVAAQTGQSLRSVQRASSDKKPAPKRTSSSRDVARMDRHGRIGKLLKQIGETLSDCSSQDLHMIRKAYKPYLEGWFGHDGKLLVEPPKSPTGTPVTDAVPANLPTCEVGGGVAVCRPNPGYAEARHGGHR